MLRILLILAAVIVLPLNAKSRSSGSEEMYLFSRPGCPYCMKVIEHLRSQHKMVKVKDISNDAAAMNELISRGGKQQVPCLYYKGQYLYESRDIMRWIDEHSSIIADAN